MKINDLAHKGRPLKMMNPMKVPQQRRQTKCIVCPPVSIVYIIVTCWMVFRKQIQNKFYEWNYLYFRDYKDDGENQEELFKLSKEKYSDSPSTNRKKTAQPSKLVSLGAAAGYTGDRQKQTDEMTDLFGNVSINPRETQQQQQQPSQFGDGGFADFESAFSSGLVPVENNCLSM